MPRGALLVANGKQALSLVAQDLRDRGVRTLLAPDFYCLTMIQPFQLEGITVRHVRTGDRALMDPTALAEALSGGHHLGVLHCEVFGARADGRLREVLESARAAGVPVVVDATHSVLDTSDDPADYLVASLRKLLPVPDGAYVTGTAGRTPLPRHPVDEAATRLHRRAAMFRRAFLAGDSPAEAYLQAVDDAEDASLLATEPAGISTEALRLLADCDPAALREARRGRAAHLVRRLLSAGLEVLNPASPECGVVVRVTDAPSVERDLLTAGISCPISWPRPPGLPRAVPWRTDWVTLPVDPDLPLSHLDRSASVVERHARPGRPILHRAAD